MSFLSIMKRSIPLMLLLCFISTLSFAQNSREKKAKLIVETDLGGDVDDQGSLVRLLLYSNDLDIRGIFTSQTNQAFGSERFRIMPYDRLTQFYVDLSVADGDTVRNTAAKILAHEYIDAYGQSYANLKKFDSNYPSPEYLKSITMSGVTTNKQPEELLIKELKLAIQGGYDLWYTNWGTLNDGVFSIDQGFKKFTPNKSPLLRVMEQCKANKIPGLAYEDLLHVLKYIDFWDQQNLRDIVKPQSYNYANDILFHMDPFQNVNDPIDLTFRNDNYHWYLRFYELTNNEAALAATKSPLTNQDFYVVKDFGQFGKRFAAKEGDTFAFMHLIANGINIIGRPDLGGWSGRASKLSKMNNGIFYMGSRDEGLGRPTDNQITRWGTNGKVAEDIKFDFLNRARWAENGASGPTNRYPIVKVRHNNQTYDGLNAINIIGRPNQKLTFDASTSTDPDGQSLTYEWRVYKEITSNRKYKLDISANKKAATVTMPSDFKSGEVLHLYLRVTDNGTVPMTRYKRVVIEFDNTTPDPTNIDVEEKVTFNLDQNDFVPLYKKGQTIRGSIFYEGPSKVVEYRVLLDGQRQRIYKDFKHIKGKGLPVEFSYDLNGTHDVIVYAINEEGKGTFSNQRTIEVDQPDGLYSFTTAEIRFPQGKREYDIGQPVPMEIAILGGRLIHKIEVLVNNRRILQRFVKGDETRSRSFPFTYTPRAKGEFSVKAKITRGMFFSQRFSPTTTFTAVDKVLPTSPKPQNGDSQDDNDDNNDPDTNGKEKEVKTITSLSDDPFNSADVVAYPNPTSNQIFLKNLKEDWILMNSLGSVIRKGNTNIIDLSNENKGVYLLRLSQDQKVIRLIKK